MNKQQLLEIAEKAFYAESGRHLKNVEANVIRKILDGQQYKRMAEDLNYTLNYVQRDIGIKLLQTLTEFFGEKVRKSNLEAVLMRHQHLLTSTPTLTPNQKEIREIKRLGKWALEKFEPWKNEIEALMLAMEAGQRLKNGVQDAPLQEYPTTEPIVALQLILDNIRERNRFSGHKGQKTVRFSRNWEYVATASYYFKKDPLVRGSLIKIFNSSGNKITEFIIPDEEVIIIDISHENKVMATVSYRSTVKLWHFYDNRITEFPCDDCMKVELNQRNSCPEIEFSPNGKYLAVHYWDKTTLCDLYGKKITEFDRDYLSFCFSPKSEYIATIPNDGIPRIWDLLGNQIAELKGHEESVHCICFSPDGEYLLTSSEDWTARLWDLHGNQITTFENDDPYCNATFSPDGKHIVVDDNCNVILWNLSGDRIHEFAIEKQRYDTVIQVGFSADSKHIFAHLELSPTLLWDLSGKKIAEFTDDYEIDLSFSPDGKYMATSFYQKEAQIWDLYHKEKIQFQAHLSRVTSVSFSPKRDVLATASDDGATRLWNLSGKQLNELKWHQGKILNVKFSPDGLYIATLSDDSTARLWDFSAKLIAEVLEGEILSIDFSSDGQHFITASADHIVRFWNLSGNLIDKSDMYSHKLLNVSFSPDGERFATISEDGRIELRQFFHFHPLAELTKHPSKVISTSFNRKGDLLATASNDCKARLWDLSGNLLEEFSGHKDAVTSVSFSPDGEILATGSDDGTAKLWNLSGKQIAEFIGHQGAITSVSFSPDSKFLATGSDNGIVRLWQVETLDELLEKGYKWLEYYLVSHPEAQEKLKSYQNKEI